MRWPLATTVQARLDDEPRACGGRAAGTDTDAAAATFASAITTGRAATTGWDPKEVWLERVHRPRLRRHRD